MYTIRASQKQTGWAVIANFDNYQEAIAEYNNQLQEDANNGWTDLATQLIDDNCNVIMEHIGDDY